MRTGFVSTAVVVCAGAAGFLGGLASQFVMPTPVHAQLNAPGSAHLEKRPGTNEIDAQRFVLVDSAGTVYGEFKMEGNRPQIVLYDKDGNVTWRTRRAGELQPLSTGQ